MPRASSPSRPRPPKPKPKPARANSPAAAAFPSPPPVRIKHEQADDKLTILVRPRPLPVPPNPLEPWKHPDELEYIRPHSWSESTLIAHLLDDAFDVPPRHPPGSSDPWCVVTSRNRSTTIVPKGYRLPLMFAMKFQWESLRLVLTSQHRDEEWKDYKFDFLHVSRLCATFLKQAQQAMASNGMDKMWRSPMFDRALTRYYRRWLVNREEFLMWFWKEFEEEEYAGDVLKKDWTRFVLKGHKGFHLTKEECAQGLSYKTLTTGLEQRSDGRFYWNLPPAPPADPENDKEKQTKKVTGKRKRGPDGDNEKEKEKDKGKGKDKEGGKGEAKKEKEKEVVKEKEKEVVKKEKEKKDVVKEKEKGKGKDKDKEMKKKKEKEKEVKKEKGKEKEKEVAKEKRMGKGKGKDKEKDKEVVKEKEVLNAESKVQNLNSVILVREANTSPSPTEKKTTAAKQKSPSSPIPRIIGRTMSSSKKEDESINPPGSSFSSAMGEKRKTGAAESRMEKVFNVGNFSRSEDEDDDESKNQEKALPASSPSTASSEKKTTDAELDLPRKPLALKVIIRPKVPATTDAEVKDDNAVSESESAPFAKRARVEGGEDADAGQQNVEENDTRASLPPPPSSSLVEDQNDEEIGKEKGRDEGRENEEEKGTIQEEVRTDDVIRRFVERWSGDEHKVFGGCEIEDIEAMHARRKMLVGGVGADPSAGGGDNQGKQEKEDAIDNDDDRILQTEGLGYPEPQPESMDIDSPAPQPHRDAGDQQNEQEKEKSADESDITPSTPAPPSSTAVPTTTTSASTPRVIKASFSTPAQLASTAALPTPTTSAPTSTLPSSAPAQPSNLSSNPYSKLITKSGVRGSLSGFFFGASGASASGSRSGSRSVAKGSDAPSAAALVEGTSKDGVREGGTGLEKRQSTWDARVSKALERAKASKVQAANGGVAMSPRAAWYVPQVPQWDAKERERVFQRAPAVRATGVTDSPVILAATRFPSSSGPSASGSSSGSGSDSTALTTPLTQPQQSSLVPAIVTGSVPSHVSLPQPPVSAPLADLTIAAASNPTATETVPESRIVEVPPPETSSESNTGAMDVTTTETMDVDPPSPRVEPSISPLITEADAPMDSRAPFSTLQMLDSQPCPQSPPQSTSPASTSSHNLTETEAPRPRPRSSPRELPPLPGPLPPGRTATCEEYQLTAAAWSGSGSSDPENDGDTHEPEGMREYHTSEHGHEHEHEHERDLQYNRTDRRYERGGYYDVYQRHSATPGSSPFRRYHPYAYPPPPGRPRYHSSFAPPYHPQSPYNDYLPYSPSASAPYRPSRRGSMIGGSLSGAHSPVHPDIDPEGTEVDGSPVATRIVSIVQDTMARLADVLSTSGSMRETGSRRMRERSSGASVSGSVSADAGTSRSGGAHGELGGDDKLVKLEDVLGQIRVLKEDHQREVNEMRNEIEGLRRQVQNLQGHCTRHRKSNEEMDTINVGSKAVLTNGVVAESSSSYPIDLTSDAQDTKHAPKRPDALLESADSSEHVITRVPPDRSALYLVQLPKLAVRNRQLRLDVPCVFVLEIHSFEHA
ncbi:hypothetical protein E4T56_gene11770 [Termitomyces sp. T112]|nr:hypothetical protein E4T56_gene11770 [Termitomyces sp. T112]